MKQGILRGVASLSLLLAITSCTDVPVAPRNTTGETPTETPSSGGGTVTNPGSGTTDPQVQPVVQAVASITIAPGNIEISAPHHTPATEEPDNAVPLSDGTQIEHESAGFPSSALLTPTFKTASGETVPAVELYWSSSNPQLATVDEYGFVQAQDTEVSGSVTITARLKSNPLVFATASVTVRNDGVLAIELK